MAALPFNCQERSRLQTARIEKRPRPDVIANTEMAIAPDGVSSR
jgi:hypothetical protein